MAVWRALSSWHLMGIISSLYLLMMWLIYHQLEHQLQYNQRAGKVFKPEIQRNGDFRMFAKECPVYHVQKHSHLTNHVKPVVKLIENGMCPVSFIEPNAEIQMEDEWNEINVRYPQYVYTVSGWIQVLRVPNYTPRPLRVIIVPHSHQDPGWKESYEGYYSSYTRRTLNNIVNKLTDDPKLKFIWSEVVFLSKWYNEPDSPRENFRRLIQNGQLEIVSGGWVMTDEAVAHYTAMVNQLIEGHLWLKNTLGIVPVTSWSVDPFGHSPTMTYMLKKSGIDHMVIQRTHFGVKRHLAGKKSLEFLWRQIWDGSGDYDVMCHMMPFLLYSVSFSCGPDPHVCCQFDFHSHKCFKGTNSIPPQPVTDKNIKKLSWALWEQYQKKAQLYQSDVLLVPHGDDFRYSSHSEWDEQFKNLNKLMAYMNSNEDMNIKIEYGTISDYFKAFSQNQLKKGFSLPTLSGDFLPYNDRDDQYWTGYYSVRPLLKHMVRVLQGKLRITEILFTLTLSSRDKKQQLDFHEDYIRVLEEGRFAVGLFQHHDAITGTSTHGVMEDYKEILQSALSRVEELFLLLVSRNIVKPDHPPKTPTSNFLSMAEPWPFEKSHVTYKVLEVDGNWLVVVTNPLTISWKSAITLRTRKPGVIKTMDKKLVPSQVNPLLDSHFSILKIYSVIFETDLGPLSTKTYQFVQQSSGVRFAKVTLYGKELGPEKFDSSFGAQRSNAEMFEIENHLIKASFSSCSGTLQYVQHKTDDHVHQMSVKLVTYGTGSWTNPFRDKSGAYIFMPDGHAKDIEVFNPPMLRIEGPVMSSVVAKLPGVLMTTTVYNITGPMGAGVHLDNLVDIGNKEWNNQEVAMRIVSDVVSPDTSVCVDLNGFQMHKKKFKSKLLIQGNFHPVTSAAFIENGQRERLTFLTAESHGVASLNGGWLEVVLDRRMMQDDWRGLNEGANDNVISPSKFILIPERRDQPITVKNPRCRLSMLADLLSEHLNNPPQTAVAKMESQPAPSAVYASSVTFLKTAFPCPYKLVNLRHLETATQEPGTSSVQALLLLHRVAVDCSYSQVFQDCRMDKQLDLNSFKNVRIGQAVETSLTGVQDLRVLEAFRVEVKDMEMKTLRLSFSR